jgi:hypothetical protein
MKKTTVKKATHVVWIMALAIFILNLIMPGHKDISLHPMQKDFAGVTIADVRNAWAKYQISDKTLSALEIKSDNTLEVTPDKPGTSKWGMRILLSDIPGGVRAIATTSIEDEGTSHSLTNDWLDWLGDAVAAR